MTMAYLGPDFYEDNDLTPPDLLDVEGDKRDEDIDGAVVCLAYCAIALIVCLTMVFVFKLTGML